MIDEMMEALLASNALVNGTSGTSFKDSWRAVEARKALEPFATRLSIAEAVVEATKDFVGPEPLKLLKRRNDGDMLIGMTADPAWIKLVETLGVALDEPIAPYGKDAIGA